MLWLAIALALFGLAQNRNDEPSQDELAQLIGSAPVGRDWQDWLLAKSWIETRWNPAQQNFGFRPRPPPGATLLRYEGLLRASWKLG